MSAAETDARGGLAGRNSQDFRYAADGHSHEFRYGAKTMAGSRLVGSVLVCLAAILINFVVRPALADDALDDYRLAVGFYNKEQWQLAKENFQEFLKNPKPHFKDDADCQKEAKQKDRKKFKGTPEEFTALTKFLGTLKSEAKQAPGFKSCLKE